MKNLMIEQLAAMSDGIQPAAVPALRVAFTIAFLIFVAAGIFIFRKRHEFFYSDPNVENDVPVVRHNREQLIIFTWGGITLVLLSILYQVWTA